MKLFLIPFFLLVNIYGQILPAVQYDITNRNTRPILGKFTATNTVSDVRKTINVLAPPYFADNTGITNSTVALQSAINFATANRFSVYLPGGRYLSDTLTLTNGVEIFGDYPSITPLEPRVMDHPLMTPAGGTWINFNGGIGFTGNNLRGIYIHDIGMTNWGSKAFSFGGDNIEGASSSLFARIVGIGNPTLGASDIGFENYNFLFADTDRVRFYNVNIGFRFVSQNNYVACGNSEHNGIFSFTYPKTAANGNTNLAGVEIITLEPTGGVTNYHTGLGVMDFYRPQVNSFHSSGGINFRIESATNSLLAIQGVRMHSIDSEGPVAVGVWINRVYSSTFSLSANANPVVAIQVGETGYDNVITSFAPSAKVINLSGAANPNTFYGVFAPSSEGLFRGVNYIQGTNLITGNFDLGKATLFNSGIGGYVTTNPPGGFTYYASYHPFGVYASQTSTNSWFLSTNSLFGDFITMGSTVQFSKNGNSYFNNSSGVGFGTFAPSAARIESRHTTLAQANLSYDDSNRTFLRTAANGNFTLSPSGGRATNDGVFRSTVFLTGTGGYTSENIDGTGTSSYHPGGILVPATSAAAYILATNTVIGPTMNASGNGWGLNAASAGWNTNGFSVGKQGAPLFAQLESRTTSGAQLSLSYDDSNRTLLTTSSGGNLTVTPSGGVANFTGNLQKQGTNVQNELRFIEADGSPSIINPAVIIVSDGTLVNNGDGSATLITGGGGSGGGATNVFVNGFVVNDPNFTNSPTFYYDVGTSNVFGYPTNLANAQIVAGAGIDATKIADGSISSTEYQSIDDTVLTLTHLGNGKQLAQDITSRALRLNTLTNGIGVFVSSNANELIVSHNIEAGANITLSTNSGAVVITSTGGGGSGDDVYVNGNNVTHPNFQDSPTASLTVTSTNVNIHPTNLANAQISASAAIARTKIANGTANHIVINDVSGTLTSEATLGATRFPALGGGDLSSAGGTYNISVTNLDRATTTIKMYGYIQLVSPHSGENAGAVFQTNDIAQTYFGQALFSNSADQSANYVEYTLVVPEDIDTSVALTASFKFRLSNTDTGTHRYVISHDSIPDSSSYNGTMGDAINLDFAGDPSGAANDVETVSGTLTGWNSNITAGQLWRIRVARDGNAVSEDASTVNSYSGPLVIRYGLIQ